MKEINVGWLSDTHVGYRQFGMVRRQQDFADAYYRAVQGMIEAKVDFIIHTGDMTQSSRPAPEDVMVLKAVEKLLQDNHKMMFAIRGQHDGLVGESWASVAKFTQNAFGMAIINAESDITMCGLKVVGIPHTSREVLLEKFKDPELKGDILMLHQAVKEMIGFPAASALSLDELPYDRFQVIAIGDIHVAKFIPHPKNADCWVGYAGSTELCSSTETSEKSWIELKFRDGKLYSFTRYPIATRPVIRLDLKTEDDITAGIQSIHQALLDNVDRHETRMPIVFVKYLNTLPKVQERIYGAFDPEQFVFQLEPVFVPATKAAKAGEPDAPAVELEMTVEDVRRQMVPSNSTIYDISAAMLQPEVDASAALDVFIDNRLKAAAETPAETESV